MGSSRSSELKLLSMHALSGLDEARGRDHEMEVSEDVVLETQSCKAPSIDPFQARIRLDRL